MRITIKHLEIGDSVRIINHECEDIVGRISSLNYGQNLVEIDNIYEAPISDVELEV